jgi:hypothetical protein
MTGDAVSREMAMYTEALKKVSAGSASLAASAHNGG